jgi:RNA polymerase sigma-70 factor (ECF subfamily)
MASKKKGKDEAGAAPPGDSTLTEKQLAEHIPVIRNYLRKIVRPDEIEDAVQTVLARALENLERYRGESSPRVWLLGIARNVGYEQARARQRGPRLALKEGEEPGADPGLAAPAPTQEERLGRREQHALALLALDGMTLDEKIALLMTYVDGVPGPEAAELVGVSFAAFRQRLSRARQAMAKKLEQVMEDGQTQANAELLAQWQPLLDPHGYVARKKDESSE